jgi:hypothetical protein
MICPFLIRAFSLADQVEFPDSIMELFQSRRHYALCPTRLRFPTDDCPRRYRIGDLNAAEASLPCAS